MGLIEGVQAWVMAMMSVYSLPPSLTSALMQGIQPNPGGLQPKHAVCQH